MSLKVFILILMIFLHIVDDYYMQGILAKLKQKSWWWNEAPQKIYSRDYVVALIAHGFSWSFMTMIPIWLYASFTGNFKVYAVIFILHGFLHAFIDNLKCNLHKINLIQDQTMHLIQIVFVWTIILI